MNLQSNGIDLFFKYNYSYYNYVVPYQKFFNSVPLGYYNYSFSLSPSELQPSGSLNCSTLDNIVIDLTNNQKVIEHPYNLKVIIKEYNILRIMGGQCALAWL
jgi:hypothetical protein